MASTKRAVPLDVYTCSDPHAKEKGRAAAAEPVGFFENLMQVIKGEK